MIERFGVSYKLLTNGKASFVKKEVPWFKSKLAHCPTGQSNSFPAELRTNFIAQLVERKIYIFEVAGSYPVKVTVP